MRYITWYACILVFCTMLYVGAWLYHWYTHQETPDLVELRAFLHEIASAAWIAVIGFLAEAFIDNNHNGIPDQYEHDQYEDKIVEDITDKESKKERKDNNNANVFERHQHTEEKL